MGNVQATQQPEQEDAEAHDDDATSREDSKSAAETSRTEDDTSARSETDDVSEAEEKSSRRDEKERSAPSTAREQSSAQSSKQTTALSNTREEKRDAAPKEGGADEGTSAGDATSAAEATSDGEGAVGHGAASASERSEGEGERRGRKGPRKVKRYKSIMARKRKIARQRRREAARQEKEMEAAKNVRAASIFMPNPDTSRLEQEMVQMQAAREAEQQEHSQSQEEQPAEEQMLQGAEGMSVQVTEEPMEEKAPEPAPEPDAQPVKGRRKKRQQVSENAAALLAKREQHIKQWLNKESLAAERAIRPAAKDANMVDVSKDFVIKHHLDLSTKFYVYVKKVTGVELNKYMTMFLLFSLERVETSPHDKKELIFPLTEGRNPERVDLPPGLTDVEPKASLFLAERFNSEQLKYMLVELYRCPTSTKAAKKLAEGRVDVAAHAHKGAKDDNVQMMAIPLTSVKDGTPAGDLEVYIYKEFENMMDDRKNAWETQKALKNEVMKAALSLFDDGQWWKLTVHQGVEKEREQHKPILQYDGSEDEEEEVEGEEQDAKKRKEMKEKETKEREEKEKQWGREPTRVVSDWEMYFVFKEKMREGLRLYAAPEYDGDGELLVTPSEEDSTVRVKLSHIFWELEGVLDWETGHVKGRGERTRWRVLKESEFTFEFSPVPAEALEWQQTVKDWKGRKKPNVTFKLVEVTKL